MIHALVTKNVREVAFLINQGADLSLTVEFKGVPLTFLQIAEQRAAFDHSDEIQEIISLLKNPSLEKVRKP